MEAPEGPAWIGPTNGDANDPTGTYVYTLVFDFSGFNPNTATISGDLASDNNSSILLNGKDAGFSYPSSRNKKIIRF